MIIFKDSWKKSLRRILEVVLLAFPIIVVLGVFISIFYYIVNARIEGSSRVVDMGLEFNRKQNYFNDFVSNLKKLNSTTSCTGIVLMDNSEINFSGRASIKVSDFRKELSSGTLKILDNICESGKAAGIAYGNLVDDQNSFWIVIYPGGVLGSDWGYYYYGGKKKINFKELEKSGLKECQRINGQEKWYVCINM